MMSHPESFADEEISEFCAEVLAGLCEKLRQRIYEQLIVDEACKLNNNDPEILHRAGTEAVVTTLTFIVEARMAFVFGLVQAFYEIGRFANRPRSLRSILKDTEECLLKNREAIDDGLYRHPSETSTICNQFSIPICKDSNEFPCVDIENLFHRSSLNDHNEYVQQAFEAVGEEMPPDALEDVQFRHPKFNLILENFLKE